MARFLKSRLHTISRGGDLMAKKRNSTVVSKLKSENKELKEELALLSDTKFLKEIKSALQDIKKGRFV